MKATPRYISEHRERVERLLSARLWDRSRESLPAILAELWGLKRRHPAGRDAATVRREIAQRMRWELAVEAREDAEDGVDVMLRLPP